MKSAIKEVLKGLALCAAVQMGIVLVFLMLYIAVLSHEPDYHDEEKMDLYTVAVNNLFAANGYISNGEVTFDPDITIIETDSYGRTLFFYSECYKDGGEPDFGKAFVIMQKSRDGYAYYYPDVCCLPYFDTVSDWEQISETLPPDYFDTFKQENDWGKELEEERCAKLVISGKKQEGALKPKRAQFNSIIYPYEVRNGYVGRDQDFCNYFRYCETDRFGRELYYVFGMTGNLLENGETMYRSHLYAIVLNSDGTCPEHGIIKFSTRQGSPARVKMLKENTGWNKTAP